MIWVLKLKFQVGGTSSLNVWSVHLRDADCPMNFSNESSKTKESALCSALGEFLERSPLIIFIVITTLVKIYQRVNSFITLMKNGLNLMT